MKMMQQKALQATKLNLVAYQVENLVAKLWLLKWELLIISIFFRTHKYPGNSKWNLDI